MDLSNYTDVFITEEKECLRGISDGLLVLEKKKDEETLNELMRLSHTIKGGSSMMGYTKLAFLAHVMEDVFDYARHGLLEITSETIDELFSAVDAMQKSLDSVKKKGTEMDLTSVSKTIKEITGVRTVGTGKSRRTKKGMPKHAKKSPEKKSKKKVLKESKEAKDSLSKLSEEIIQYSYIKVPVKRLDAMVDLVEGLLIDKMRLENLPDQGPELKKNIAHLSRQISDIQYEIMQARLVPISQVFDYFPRMVRDLAREKKKKINLTILGGAMELDRTVLDKLALPLIHLIRNAVDHGIDKKGTIKIIAMRERNNTTVAVENDGRSIDLEKVKESALKRGIISEKKLSTFSDEQVMNLIFNPNLSTKEKVTKTSGRGVGMSVVKNFVEQVGGKIVIRSPLNGGGTRVTLELPLTLAIINALLVTVSNETFAVPFTSIERSVLVSSQDIKSLGDQDVAVVDGAEIPLFWTEKVFNLERKHVSSRTDRKNLVIIVNDGGERAGIIVDSLVGGNEIIVKPLAAILRKVGYFSGSTILGDGKTVLIIDVPGLLEDKTKLLRVT
ncbi:chemotaxis protein CheA [Patescibacteria group bacterium]|nr:chemotaxis protein CheA [Patescibacteria group bacterium]